MDILIRVQRSLYLGMADSLRSVEDLPTLALVLISATLFGAVHALMPGHGKSVLVSYHLGRPGHWWHGLVTGTLLSLTHIGTAVVLVLAGFAVISRSFVLGGRTPSFEIASGGLIVFIGLFLFWRALRGNNHHESTGDGRALALVTGLIPCPLTTFILTFAIANRILEIGLLAVAAMSFGVVFTIASFATGAVLTRDRLLALLRRTGRWRCSVGRWLDFIAAFAVVVLGLSMLSGGLRFA